MNFRSHTWSRKSLKYVFNWGIENCVVNIWLFCRDLTRLYSSTGRRGQARLILSKAMNMKWWINTLKLKGMGDHLKCKLKLKLTRTMSG